MERLVFIHGSSVGKSKFIPKNPTNICSDIADKYFSGRTLRQKMSATKLALFVDLYRASNGTYCVYSFVNNECLGANASSREGQYFAITILCKDHYVFPELIYQMLSSAYNEMLQEKHIIDNSGGKDQYVISQFSEAQDYLTEFLDLIEKNFDKFTGGAGRPLPAEIKVADYDSWNGFKVNTENCNSIDTFNQICDIGRLYIAEEYDSNKTQLVNLQKKVLDLEKENNNLKLQQTQANRKKNATINAEKENLKTQLKEKDEQIQSLSKENDKLRSTYDIVRKELGKVEKAGEKITNTQENILISKDKNKNDLLKIILQLVIFVLILLSSLMNYMFFRDLSDNVKQQQKAGTELTDTINKAGEDGEEYNPEGVSRLEISQNEIDVDASGTTKNITINSDEDWTCPSNNTDWFVLLKKDNNTLTIKVSPNLEAKERSTTFMIKSGDIEQQVTIRQKGKVAQQASSIDYQIIITDASKGTQIQNGTTVSSGQRLIATVTNPSAGSRFGWKYQNCEGQRDNRKSVNITVGRNNNEEVIIAYGDLEDTNKRSKIRLKIKSTSNDKRIEMRKKESKMPETEQKQEENKQQSPEKEETKSTSSENQQV